MLRARLFYRNSFPLTAIFLGFLLCCLLLRGAPSNLLYSIAGQPYSASKILNTSPIGNQKLSFDEVYAKLAPSTVLIETESRLKAGRHLGAGIIVRSDGFVLTNAHVVDRGYREEGYVKVTLQNNRDYVGTIIGSNEAYDLALLKIDSTSELAAVTWADYIKEDPKDEEKEVNRMASSPIYALGFPRGQKWYMTQGTLSGLSEEGTLVPWKTPIKTLWTQPGLLAPGNSGGPLINAAGQVIGINYRLSGDYGASIALDTIRGFLDEMLPKILEKSNRVY
jgi:S1-C subfamily serine protease